MPDFTEVIENWNIFRIGLINENGSSLTVKVCLPLNEFLVPFVSENNDPCLMKTQMCEYAMKNNQEYLSQIRQHYLINRPATARSKKPIIINQTSQNLNVNQPSPNFNFKQMSQPQPQVQSIADQDHLRQLSVLTKDQLIQKIVDLENQLKLKPQNSQNYQVQQTPQAQAFITNLPTSNILTQVNTPNYQMSPSSYNQYITSYNPNLGSNLISQYQQQLQQPIQHDLNSPNSYYGIQNVPDQNYMATQQSLIR